ncbi:MAG: NAD(P)/FAD-dependent oxidoreductase [Chthoniobacteraceae bacterium]
MKIYHRNLPRVVVVGGGFGGLTAVQALKRAHLRVTLVDRQNHHLFQPLLYQVATAALSPSDIGEPLRRIVRHQDNCEVLLENVREVKAAEKKLITDSGEIPYDYLVLATGARHTYFGHDEWEKFAPGLKSMDDALEIRRRMLIAFEHAEMFTDDAERRAALTFVVVGGGPTGVEMAGAISEIARQTLIHDFRHIDAGSARVILIDGGDRLLSAYVPELSESARRQLYDIGVEVRLGARAAEVDAAGVTLHDGSRIPAKTVVWAAGNAASPVGRTLGVPTDRMGRVIVNPDLSIPDHPEIFVIGDLAHVRGEGGDSLPGVAPVAMQQGRHVAKNIVRLAAGGWSNEFVYNDRGSMATIGRYAAVADLNFARFTGFPAWLAWLFIHLVFLVSFRSKIGVLFSWGYTYLVFGRKARLITGREFDKPPPRTS